MRKFGEEINKYRVKDGRLGSTDEMGDAGAFRVPFGSGNTTLVVIATSGDPPIPGTEIWEHVSVRAVDTSATNAKYFSERTPTWDEMCFIKDLFWEPEECVIQYHPPKSKYRNIHPHVLHLWRKAGFDLPTPPSIFIG